MWEPSKINRTQLSSLRTIGRSALQSEYGIHRSTGVVNKQGQVCITMRPLCPVSGNDIISLPWTPLRTADSLLSQRGPGGHLGSRISLDPDVKSCSCPARHGHCGSRWRQGLLRTDSDAHHALPGSAAGSVQREAFLLGWRPWAATSPPCPGTLGDRGVK